MSFGSWLPAVANLFFVWTPVHAHIYEDNLGGQISLLGPLVCFAVFIAICACFCRECRRREAMLASTTAVPADPFHTPGPVPYGPAVAGARPAPMAQPVHPPYSPPYSQPPAPSQSQPPPPGFLGYPYGSMPQEPPPPYEYK
uniref:Basic tail secreted protein n=1 Tax=Rhipicephalus zambeziensis TaxID=60191 RepID=A0A224YCJ2_9ACAR